MLSQNIFVDAHVHIHDHFSLSRLFLISLQNFRKYHDANITGIMHSFLLLTESCGVNKFANLKEHGDQSGNFSIHDTGERETLKVTTLGGQTLYVVAGRQIVTAEKVEVLALGLDVEYPDGNTLKETLKDLNSTKCLRVLPWGAGKWIGKRGKIIQSLISTWSDGPLFLGDNGNRPSCWPLPPIFSDAKTRGIFNLPGSDPLPFSEQEKKAGSFGFSIPGEVDPSKPFSSLKEAIFSAPNTIDPFGTPESLQPFMKHQITMQIVKRRR